MGFWKTKQMTPNDREVTASLKALKTLTCREGRVSISPSEVTGQAGYLESRRQAAALLTCHTSTSAGLPPTWALMDALGLEGISQAIAKNLQDDRRAGLSLEQALAGPRLLRGLEY
jgi:hypothetical protein